MKKWFIVIPALLSFGFLKQDKPSDPGISIPPGDLEAFYEQWFNSPYEYMFDGDFAFEYNGKSFTKFSAGINGIMKYGGLYDCIHQYNNQHINDHVSGNSPFDEGWEEEISTMAGLPVYNSSKEDDGFSWLNPEIVEWGIQNLVPDPDAGFLGITYRKVYQKMFSRFFRLMYKSYQWLNDSNLWDNECKNYFKIANKNDWTLLDYLDRRFRGKLSEYELESNGTRWTVGMSMGFWLRRHTDRTDRVLFDALNQMLGKFDRDWLNKQYK